MPEHSRKGRRPHTVSYSDAETHMNSSDVRDMFSVDNRVKLFAAESRGIRARGGSIVAADKNIEHVVCHNVAGRLICGRLLTSDWIPRRGAPWFLRQHVHPANIRSNAR